MDNDFMYKQSKIRNIFVQMYTKLNIYIYVSINPYTDITLQTELRYILLPVSILEMSLEHYWSSHGRSKRIEIIFKRHIRRKVIENRQEDIKNPSI